MTPRTSRPSRPRCRAPWSARRPELAIYLAGADPFVGDRLGRLALSKEGLAARDRLVLDALAARGIPVAIAMAGGYAESIDDIVDIHAATVGLALQRHGPAAAPKPRVRARVAARRRGRPPPTRVLDSSRHERPASP